MFKNYYFEKCNTVVKNYCNSEVEIQCSKTTILKSVIQWSKTTVIVKLKYSVQKTTILESVILNSKLLNNLNKSLNRILTFESVHKILKPDHSNGSY